MTDTDALTQARALCPGSDVAQSNKRNRIAAALKRAYADGIASHAGASLTARGEIADRALKEADALERGEG